MARKATLLMSAILVFVASQVYGLGLGTASLQSALNQPLQLRIEIVQLGNVNPGDIRVTIAAPEDFLRFNIDRIAFLSDIRISIESGAGGVFAVLTSTQLVREPYLSFVLDTRWPNGRVLSEHTLLLDLPVFDNRSQSASVRQPISPVLQAPTSPPPVLQAPAPAPAPAQPTQPAVNNNAAPASVPAPTPPPEAVSVAPAIPVEAVPIEPPAPAPAVLAEPAPAPEPIPQPASQQAAVQEPAGNPAGRQVSRLPNLSDIESTDQQPAVAEVNRPASAPESVQVQPLAAPASGPDSQTAPVSGQLSVITTDDANAAATRSALQEENAELDARIDALQNQLALREEEMDRASIEREELIARLDDLDAQIASAMEIITLQDLQLAQLQESLVEAARIADEQQVAAVNVTPAPQAPGLLNNLLRLLTSTTLLLILAVVLVVSGLVFVLLRRNKKVVGRFDEGELEELEDDDTESFVSASGNASNIRATERIGSGASSGAVKGALKKPELDDELSKILNLSNDFDDYDSDDAEEPEDNGNLLEEADELIFSRRYAHATTLLKSAVRSNPDNVDAQLKLLEVYVEQGDEAAFADLADELGRFESEEIASSIAALRSRFDSEELEDTQIGKVADDDQDDVDVDLGAFEVAQAIASAGLTKEEEVENVDFDLSDLSEEIAEPKDDKPSSSRSGKYSFDDEESLSITFDLGSGDAVESPSEAPQEPEQDFESFSFDSPAKVETAFGVDRGTVVDAESDTGESGLEFTLDTHEEPRSAEVAKSGPGAEELETFDFDLNDSSEEKTVVEAKSEPAVSPKAEDSEVEFDFDLDDFEIDEEGEDKSEKTPDVSLSASDVESLADDDNDIVVDEEIEIEIDDVEFETDTLEIGADSDTDEMDFLSDSETQVSTNTRDEEDDFNFLSADDEAATKLELAYAFQKMNDPDGAREILEEVIREGNAAQIQEARELLKTLKK